MSGESTLGGKRNKAIRSRGEMIKPSEILGKGSKLKALSTTAGGKRNMLLPSRMIVGSATSANPQGGIQAPTKTKAVLQNSYEFYLQSLLMDLVVQKSIGIQEKVSSEVLATKCVESVPKMTKSSRKIYSNQGTVSVFNNVVSLQKLGCVFHEDTTRQDMESFAFTLEESLLQILGVLSSKFDRMIVEGVEEPGSGSFLLFCHEENEIQRLLERLRDSSRKGSCFGFGFLLKEALKDISLKLELAKGKNGEVKQKLKFLLESCSRAIMNRLVLGESRQAASSSSFNTLQSYTDSRSHDWSMATLRWNQTNQ